MHRLESLLGLLDRADPAYATAEDFDGVHGPALRQWQELGFVSREPGPIPVPSCPDCEEGVPYAVNGRMLCPRCHSDVDPRHLLVWPLDITAFLDWLAGQLSLRGGVRRVSDDLWQLGTWAAEGDLVECFYGRGSRLTDSGRTRISAYRNAIVFVGPDSGDGLDVLVARRVGLLDLLRMDDALTVTDLGRLLRPRGNVRFDATSGALWVGDVQLGEVPVGSKEFFFLDCLARHLDQFVAYADIKHFVLKQSGSRDATEEATFCQGLKSRIKKKWVATIDRLIVTTNKGDGYRLRRQAEL